MVELCSEGWWSFKQEVGQGRRMLAASLVRRVEPNERRPACVEALWPRKQGISVGCHRSGKGGRGGAGPRSPNQGTTMVSLGGFLVLVRRARCPDGANPN